MYARDTRRIRFPRGTIALAALLPTRMRCPFWTDQSNQRSRDQEIKRSRDQEIKRSTMLIVEATTIDQLKWTKQENEHNDITCGDQLEYARTDDDQFGPPSHATSTHSLNIYGVDMETASAKTIKHKAKLFGTANAILKSRLMRSTSRHYWKNSAGWIYHAAQLR